jgi:rhamnogalacturonyl hydrolase YesR
MSCSATVGTDLECSVQRVVTWVRTHQYRGYEPADGNLSPLFRLTRGRVLPMRVLQQTVLRAPFNLRPFIGIHPHESAIGRGYMAWGLVRMGRRTGDGNLRDEAVACLQWLMVNRSQDEMRFCWGDPYEYATRAGRRRRGQPLLIWSALIGHAFLDAYDWLQDPRYLTVAEGVRDWILALPRERTATGDCLSYVAARQSSIHNASVVGGAFLARVGALAGHDETIAVARSAMSYTCSRQRRDGSWYYAEEPRYSWIDNFHTGYNLSALRSYRDATKDQSFDECVRRGTQFYTARLFEDDGRPKYFHDKSYPIDIQCAAQSIDTLATLGEEDPHCLALAMKVAKWTIEHMQGPAGYFYYRDLGWTKVTTPMLHWGQGSMVKALATLIEAIGVKRW